MAERADEYQNKSFLLQTNERIHERIHEQTNEATYGGSTLPKNWMTIILLMLMKTRLK